MHDFFVSNSSSVDNLTFPINAHQFLLTGGFKSPGRGRGGGSGMRGGKKVIIEAHRHEGDYVIKSL